MANGLMMVQGGGPTAVFNTSLAAAIEHAQASGAFTRIYGARFGAAGLSRGDLSELTSVDTKQLTLLQSTPGAALGSSRHNPSEEDLHHELEVLRALNVRSMLFMGGNGTMHGARLFIEFCAAQGYEIQAIGIPKTVDNDLAITDRSPGFASAARYVAQVTQELGLDVSSLPQPVSILETMGRSVGWLAASAALAKEAESDAPQVILIPEIAFDQQKFLANVEDAVSRNGWAVVVVAEGIRHADGSLVYSNTDATQQDALKRPFTGGVGRHLSQVVSTELKIRCRSEIPGLLGRASVAHRSEQDVIDAATVAKAGVHALLQGHSNHMVALAPLGDIEVTKLVPLDRVAGIERTIPVAWLQHDTMTVNDGFRAYLQPLVGPLPLFADKLPTSTLTHTGAV